MANVMTNDWIARCDHNTVKKLAGYHCPGCATSYDCAPCLGEHRDRTGH